MASFCTNCGAALTDAGPFCRQCGARVAHGAPAPADAAAPSAPVAQQPIAPPSKSPIAKILLTVLVVFLMLGALGLAAVFYVGYKMKGRVERAAQEYGIDSSRPSGPAARRVDVCSLVTKSEAEEIMGTAIDRIEGAGSNECHYYGKPLSSEDRQAQFDRAKEALDKASSQPDLRALEDMSKTMTGDMAHSGPYFGVQVDWNGGRAAMAGFRLAAKAMGVDQKAANINGVGDEAYVMPMGSMFVFRKGATSVQIDTRMLMRGRDRGLEIAKIVEGRLEY